MNGSAEFPATQGAEPWKQFICIACGLIYDEEEGDPDSGLAPGTRFKDIPDGWECPVCGVTKRDFKPFVRKERASIAVGAGVIRERGVVIIGAGMAGWAMAEAIRSRDSQLPITMITACSGDRYNKPELSVSFTQVSSPDSLIRDKGAAEAQRLGINLVNNTFVVSVSPVRQEVRTTRGTFDYTKLVIAQGSRTTLPPYLPEHLCWRMNLLSDWSALQPRLQGPAKRIAIVGAGMVGCELAENLCQMGHRVFLLSRNSLPLNDLLPEVAGKRLLAAQAALGVTFLDSKEIHEVKQLTPELPQEPTPGAKLITFSTDETLRVDEIIATTGVSTDSRIALRAQLKFNNGIVVDTKSLETSQKDIFAIGDCVSFDGKSYRYIGLIDQQVNIVAESVISDSRNDQYKIQLPPVMLKTKSCPVKITGVPDRSSQWVVIEETDSYLLMKQIQADSALATISVGKAA